MLLAQEPNMSETASRNADLKQIRRERPREMQYDVESRASDVRSHRPIELRDDLDQSDADFQRDLELAVFQMRRP
jgi:hypothetical protein